MLAAKPLLDQAPGHLEQLTRLGQTSRRTGHTFSLLVAPN